MFKFCSWLNTAVTIIIICSCKTATLSPSMWINNKRCKYKATRCITTDHVPTCAAFMHKFYFLSGGKRGKDTSKAQNWFVDDHYKLLIWSNINYFLIRWNTLEKHTKSFQKWFILIPFFSPKNTQKVPFTLSPWKKVKFMHE